jgi:hypothetical protein
MADRTPAVAYTAILFPGPASYLRFGKSSLQHIIRLWHKLNLRRNPPLTALRNVAADDSYGHAGVVLCLRSANWKAVPVSQPEEGGSAAMLLSSAQREPTREYLNDIEREEELSSLRNNGIQRSNEPSRMPNSYLFST